MIVIREEQFRALDAEASRGFRDEACRRLQRNLPSLCARLGEEDLPSYVAAATAWAAGRGIRATADLHYVLHLLLLAELDPRDASDLVLLGSRLRGCGTAREQLAALAALV